MSCPRLEAPSGCRVVLGQGIPEHNRLGYLEFCQLQVGQVGAEVGDRGPGIGVGHNNGAGSFPGAQTENLLRSRLKIKEPEQLLCETAGKGLRHPWGQLHT